MRCLWIVIVMGLLVSGCGPNNTDPIPALGMSINQEGEGTTKSPAKISMKVNTPDGGMRMEMRVTDKSFSMSLKGE